MIYGKKHCTAILLAGGSGKRMGGAVAKQFLELDGKPVIWYCLEAIEQSEIIDDCILVVADKDVSYMREQILNKYGFQKVLAIAKGGAERYESVMNGLELLEEIKTSCDSGAGSGDYIFIQDGARPFLTEELLEKCYRVVSEDKACVAAVPSKDTVKISDDEGYAVSTPERKNVWIVQTPQVFDHALILGAYRALKESLDRGEHIFVTDDASVVEQFTDTRVKMVEASYRNIKLTTPEDMEVARGFLK